MFYPYLILVTIKLGRKAIEKKEKMCDADQATEEFLGYLVDELIIEDILEVCPPRLFISVEFIT